MAIYSHPMCTCYVARVSLAMYGHGHGSIHAVAWLPHMTLWCLGHTWPRWPHLVLGMDVGSRFDEELAEGKGATLPVL